MAAKWTAEQIPDQAGRKFIVTGANSGLGLSTCEALAAHDAHVVMACRDLAKGERARQQVLAGAPEAHVELAPLDLADLSSVAAFAASEQASGPLDVLINNAGLMAPPRGETKDGFELQFGTNHLGHFALTAQLIDRMPASTDPRVVTVASGAHHMGRMSFEDPMAKRHYFRWSQYARSKLANLLFAFELDRRLRAAGSPIKSVAAHPGYAATNLQSAAPPALDRAVMKVMNPLVAQSADLGALPQLFAATAPGVNSGDYYGPDGVGEFRGHPRRVGASGAARNEQDAARLWALSEELTGVSFAVPAAA
ncbi:MAG TPA: oxidoreductase [Solirubrobacteraceae bacterium]|nr:oxidoreductase [Solirubrobacteraceae bacterium]